MSKPWEYPAQGFQDLSEALGELEQRRQYDDYFDAGQMSLNQALDAAEAKLEMLKIVLGEVADHLPVGLEAILPESLYEMYRNAVR